MAIVEYDHRYNGRFSYGHAHDRESMTLAVTMTMSMPPALTAILTLTLGMVKYSQLPTRHPGPRPICCLDRFVRSYLFTYVSVANEYPNPSHDLGPNPDRDPNLDPGLPLAVALDLTLGVTLTGTLSVTLAIITGSDDHMIRLWDFVEGECIRILEALTLILSLTPTCVSFWKASP